MPSCPFLPRRPFLAALLSLVTSLSTVPLPGQPAHRQAALTVRVQTTAGVPLPGASVQVDMVNPAFRFGSAVDAAKVEPGNAAYDARTVDALQQYFNSITLENSLKWTEYETRGAPRTLQLMQAVFALKAFKSDERMRQRGHATVWGTQWFVPADVRAMSDPAAIRTRILNHITAYHGTFRDRGIDNFDLYNEPLSERAFLINKLVPNATLAQEAAEIAPWFRRAKEVDPAAVLFINEYNLLNFWQEDDARIVRYKELIDAIRDAGGEVGGIGLQGHMDRFITKAQITRRLNLLAAPMAPTANHPQGLPGLPLEITELDINTQQWTGATPAQQAEVTANVLDAAFEHPSVQGVTIWGMNDSAHWRRNAIMFDDSTPTQWRIKPSGQVWIDRVKGTWWTKVAGLSNANGTYGTTVFKGSHRILVEYQGRRQEVVHNITDPTELTVKLDLEPVDTANSRLANMSVRAAMNPGQTLIIGFVTSEPMPILLRAAGPALKNYDVSNAMDDPRFRVFAGASDIGGNENWPAGLEMGGAFAFPANSLDAAGLFNLGGAHTAHVTGSGGGIVLVEGYDRSAEGAAARLRNVSARNRVGTGADVLIAGFVVEGSGKIRLLIRAIGPKLIPFGVPNVLADPKLDLYRIVPGGTPVLIRSNDNWDLGVTSGPLNPVPTLGAGDKDSAMEVYLDAGYSYTAQVSGVGGATGEALVEVYVLP